VSDVEERPVVSVIMPVRNMAATIGSQLGALERQDFTEPWEVVVADNRSTDGTSMVVKRWQDRLRLRLVEAGACVDSGYARNVAVSAAEGELLAFCDADDEVRPDWLRMMVGALRDSALVVGRLEHGRLNPVRLADAYDRDETGVGWWGFLPAGAGANLGVRRSAFEQAGGFPQGYRRGTDAGFCWRVQLAGHELVVEPRAVVDRRLRALSWWQVFRLHVRDGIGVARLYHEFRYFGMPRSSPRDVIYDWASIPVLLASGQRYRTARVAGRQVGRIVGSIRLPVPRP
jgi:glycosyltransferase involved in cell wall biosynthesis